MVRAAIIHFPTRGQRQAQRQKLGTLQSNLVLKITQKRYANHFCLFMEYLQTTRPNFPAETESYDICLSEYLEVLWDTGEPKTACTYTVAAVQHYLPQLRKKLPRSWKLKAIWDKLELPCQAVPLRLDSLLGIMGYFWKKGYPEMACGCAIAFNGLLRTGELLQLLVSDCTFTDNQCVLTLRNTKSGQRRLLQDESVVITDPLTLTLLVKLTKRKQPGHPLLPLSPAKFRTLWNHMRSHLSLTQDKFIPYSLRRGGATWYFEATGSFSKTMLRGRWQHLKTCKLYIAQSQQALAHSTLPQEATHRLHYFSEFLRPQLARWASQGCVEGIDS